MDEEFSKETNHLLEAAKSEKITFVVSDVVLRELLRAPKEVREMYESIPDGSVELLPENMEALRLAEAYVVAKAVTVKSQNDAKHSKHTIIPDGIFVSPKGEVVAFELECSERMLSRFESKSSDYRTLMFEGIVQKVLWDFSRTFRVRSTC